MGLLWVICSVFQCSPRDLSMVAWKCKTQTQKRKCKHKQEQNKWNTQPNEKVSIGEVCCVHVAQHTLFIPLIRVPTILVWKETNYCTIRIICFFCLLYFENRFNGTHTNLITSVFGWFVVFSSLCLHFLFCVFSFALLFSFLRLHVLLLFAFSFCICVFNFQAIVSVLCGGKSDPKTPISFQYPCIPRLRVIGVGHEQVASSSEGHIDTSKYRQPFTLKFIHADNRIFEVFALW